MYQFLFQSGAFWDMGQVHCGICEISQLSTAAIVHSLASHSPEKLTSLATIAVNLSPESPTPPVPATASFILSESSRLSRLSRSTFCFLMWFKAASKMATFCTLVKFCNRRTNVLSKRSSSRLFFCGTSLSSSCPCFRLLSLSALACSRRWALRWSACSLRSLSARYLSFGHNSGPKFGRNFFTSSDCKKHLSLVLSEF